VWTGQWAPGTTGARHRLNGNGNDKCSTYDQRNINNNGGTLSVCDAELEIHHHSFPRVEQLWMQTGDTRDDGLWSYEFGPSGTQFENTPATMTVFVTAAELQSMGLDPDQLSIAYVSSPNHEDWQVIGVDYDWDSQSISAPVWHFSRYALYTGHRLARAFPGGDRSAYAPRLERRPWR
jgi:hypothetical protein